MITIQDHRVFAVPQLLIDSDIAEAANICASLWFDYVGGNSRLQLNAVLAHIEQDHIICFSGEFCHEMTANVSFISDGHVGTVKMMRTPMLTNQQALGMALRMAEEIGKAKPSHLDHDDKTGGVTQFVFVTRVHTGRTFSIE